MKVKKMAGQEESKKLKGVDMAKGGKGEVRGIIQWEKCLIETAGSREKRKQNYASITRPNLKRSFLARKRLKGEKPRYKIGTSKSSEERKTEGGGSASSPGAETKGKKKGAGVGSGTTAGGTGKNSEYLGKNLGLGGTAVLKGGFKGVKARENERSKRTW